MEGYPPSDWNMMLQLLRSEDEMCVYQGAMSLREALQFAQENQMHGFSTDQYLDILVKIIVRDPMTDLSNEVKFFAIQSATTLMDIFPSLVNGFVSSGIIKGMTSVLQTSFGFIDLSEACIKAFEKIVYENPPAVLKSGAVAIILQQMDFFEGLTQQKIFSIIQKIARHSTQESDFDENILPILPFICMSLSLDGSQDQKKIEDISQIIVEMQDSFCIYYSPIHDFQKVSDQYNKLLESGVYDIILMHIKSCSEITQKLIEKDENQMDIDDEQIQTANQNNTLSHQTKLNFFKILENASRYSSKVSNKFFGESTLIANLIPFLPHNFQGKKKQYNSDDYPFINDVINLMGSVLSDKKDTTELDNTKDPVKLKRLQSKLKYENEKREYQLSEKNRVKINGIAESLLPRVFFVYESTINPQQRIKTLAVIDKIIALFDNELLKNFIEPNQFANFINQIIWSKHSSSLDMSLKITKKVLDCSPFSYSVPFIREGVSQLVKDISTVDKFKVFMGIGKDIDITDQQFDVDIYRVKEELSFTKLNNPDDHMARDFYERRLLDLVEKHKAKTSGEKSDQIVNTAMVIVEQSAQIIKDYFENKEFLEKLEGYSPQNKKLLGLKAELTEISNELIKEALMIRNTVEEMSEIRRLLTRICELLSMENCAVTSYEFRESKLLMAFDILLTKSPNQAKSYLEKQKFEESGEEMKRSDELEMEDLEKQSKNVSKKEGRCLINRLKLFAHVMLMHKGKFSPLNALIELNHKIISENDSLILGKETDGNQRQKSNFGGYIQQNPGQAGEYEHCINALRQLQRRVTVNLVYESKQKTLKNFKDIVETDQNEEDSIMEDMSNVNEDDQIIDEIPLQKGKSAFPAMMNLAGSPKKEAQTELDKANLILSKVFQKRDYLYCELKNVPVTVEQSSCLSTLEDFLRNRIKTIEQVKSLKSDYGGFGSFGQGSQFSSSLGGAFGSHYQSITQKILRKNLGNGARKILDSANERLTKILNAETNIHIKMSKPKKKKKTEYGDEEMEGERNGSNEDQSGEDNESDHEDDHSGSNSGYGSEDEEAQIEKRRQLDVYVEEVTNEIISSSLPEDQQHLLIKILSRQHTFMLDQLRMNIEDAAGDDEDMQAARDEEMCRLEDRIEDFQETMERIQTLFMEKKAAQRDQKTTKPVAEEEVKKEAAVDEKKDNILSDSDHEMTEQVNEVDNSEEDKQKNQQPQLKLSNPNDAEMMKPADVSDFQEDQPLEEIDTDKKETEPKVDESLPVFLESKKSLDKMLEKELAEQDQKIQKALEKERHQKQKIKEPELSQQTKEILDADLEELIKDNGEDIEFEFFYEGKQIYLNQSIFEIVKENENKRKQVEINQHKQIKEREQELMKKLKDAEAKAEKSEADIGLIKRETARLREIMIQLSSQYGGFRGGGFFSSMTAHRITFRIKDKSEEIENFKRQRIDSLQEIYSSSPTLKRTRTKSEAVQDVSSQSINEFVSRIIKEEFKVFDQQEEPKKKLETIAEDKDQIIISSETKEDHKQKKEKLQLKQVERSLKILKVLNYLYTNQDLISDDGVKLIMKANSLVDPGSKGNSPIKSDPVAENTDFNEPGFSDNDLIFGFSEIKPSLFYHQKLDSYLQRSIKDPYILLQGGISARLNQIYKNCPFLFPFTTKQLYFKLVSFISAIDVHRGIYFLQQYLHQQQGISIKPKNSQKEQQKKISKQKISIQRDKLVEFSFQLISKIEKRSFLEIEFQGEAGTGLGPTLEYYDNIADEFKNWNIKLDENTTHKMWSQLGDNMLYPSPVCIKTTSKECIKQIYEIFRLCGTLVAKAIVDDRQIDLPISPLFWKICLGSQMTIFDYQKIDKSVFKNTLSEFQIIANKAQEIDKQCRDKNLDDSLRSRQLEGLSLSNGCKVQDYCLFFTLPQNEKIELIPGGKDKEVNLDNTQDYVDLVLHYTFHETIKIQVQAFKKGFNSIFPIASLAPFTHSSSQEEELETMVCGIRCNDQEWQNQEELMKNIDPGHGFTRKSQMYLNFIRYITELSATERPMFLKFLTGSKRLPIGGFKSLTPHLMLVPKTGYGDMDKVLPSVMACQNYVKSPNYSSYEVMKSRYDFAIKEGQQNFSLS